jgi:hypothetical protein
MKKILLSLTAAFLSGVLLFAQSTSQVSGPVSAGVNLTLQNPLSLGTASFPLALPSLVQANLQTGVGIGKANQLFAAQWTVTNGFGRKLDLYNFGGISDPVGNPYAMLNLKLLMFQNLGASTGVIGETNALLIMSTNSPDTFTNLLGQFVSGAATTNSGITLPGPSGAPGSANTPTLIFWSPGDVGWQIGPNPAGTNHVLVLTNTAPGSVITVNIYAVGSTNL